MNNQVLINLIKELKKSKLVPSEKKTAALANFNGRQVELFLNLKENGFVNRSNLNYVIGEISKIKELGPVSKDAIRGLWNKDRPVLNQDILKFILHELQYNPNIGVTNIDKLSEICQKNHYFFDYYFATREIIDSPKLRNMGLIGGILDSYSKIHNITTNYGNLIARLNSIILDQDILSSFQACEDKKKAARDYGAMLSFFMYIDNMTLFDKCKEMISSLARNKKLDIDNVSTLLYSCSKLEDIKNLGYLESILMKDFSWGSSGKIINILNRYEQKVEDDSNLAFLTNRMSIRFKCSQIFSKEEKANFYYQLLSIIDNPVAQRNLSMDGITDFIIPIFEEPDFIKYSKENGLGFIESAFKSGKEYLDTYLALSVNVNMTDDLYKSLLNSFTPDLDCEQLESKLTVYGDPEVTEAYCENPDILRTLNKVIDDKRFIASDEELALLTNPDFLKSDFFQRKYANLIYGISSPLTTKSLEYRKNFFNVLSTLNFNDSNISFYVNSLLTKKDPNELLEIYKSRVEDERGSLSDISTSLYDILSYGDEKQLEEYLAMLEVAPSGLDIKADTKVVYQKKIGKKKN